MEKIKDKGDGAVVHAQVYLDGGCSLSEGEFGIRFTGFSGPLEMSDFELVTECIENSIDELGLRPETYANVTVREDGEWEDVHWHKYYLIERFSLHEYGD